jgi:hypothetical protein
MNPAKFNVDEAQRAADTWGANCGPGALAAALDLTLEDVRPHLRDFPRKRYTNPLMMYGALKSLGVAYLRINDWPTNGVVRVQWEGPWTAPGVPARVAYRHTHWIGSRYDDAGIWIFDINCICAGGWVKMAEWRHQVVPWLLKRVEPDGDGGWHATHYLKFSRPA